MPGEQLDLTITGLPTGGRFSIQYYLDNRILYTKIGTAGLAVNSDKIKMGQHTASALVFLNTGRRLRVSSAFMLLPAAPKQFRYNAVNKFCHNSTAYTQGLQIYDGILYETTGLRAVSMLRTVKTMLKTKMAGYLQDS